jgi:hypothetical protein
MDSIAKKGFLLAGMMTICEIAVLSAAHAEPPLQKVTTALVQSRASKGQDRASVRLETRQDSRLDLRPPSAVQPNNEAAAEDSFAGTHRLFRGESLFRADAHDPADAASTHVMSPLQNMAHNFQKEGLPIAKLFQSNSSLVHVGLNSKGKPGLWIVHKTH